MFYNIRICNDINESTNTLIWSGDMHSDGDDNNDILWWSGHDRVRTSMYVCVYACVNMKARENRTLTWP